jgi:hypothetical protein
MYADDAHSAGHFFTAIRRTLWRVVCGRESGLMEAPHKCGLLAAPRWRVQLDTLIAPLRCGIPDAWPMLDSMKVLGVTFTAPGDDGRIRDTLAGSLAGAVIEPIQRLTREVEEGARKGTALFLLHRYVLPVLAYHQGAWGLLAASEAWHDVDAALDAFCTALCPTDLRERLRRGHLRRELGLPRGAGGLGVPHAAAEAPLVAAALWPRQRALDAGARPELVAVAYQRTTDEFHRSEWHAVTVDARHKAAAKAIYDALPTGSGAEKRRLEQNAMRGGTIAFAVVPWRADLALDNFEFDVVWRLVFGGITPEMAKRIDDPANGFAWRGARMEWAFAQALHDCLPPGSVATGQQPAPEVHPPGVEDTGDRADVDVLTKIGGRHVFDIRTINVQCQSGVRSTAEAQCAAAEADKTKHYGMLYRSFAAFIITLSGAVPQASAKALTKVVREAAGSERYYLDWEPARWTEDILHRLAVEMVKTITVIAVREVAPPRMTSRGRHPGRVEPPRQTAPQCRAVHPRRAFHAVRNFCHVV